MYSIPRVRQGMCTLVVPATKVDFIQALYFPTGDKSEKFKIEHTALLCILHFALNSLDIPPFQGSVSHCMGWTDLRERIISGKILLD